MTFDDDFVRLNLIIHPVNLPLKRVGLEWPPPVAVFIGQDDGLGPNAPPVCRKVEEGDDEAFVMIRTRFSLISDEERAEMTHVCRGAEYGYLRPDQEVPHG